MAKKQTATIDKFVKQIERNAKQLRADVKRFSKNTHLPHSLDELAAELRRGAATVASEIEHYLHQVGLDLERPGAKARKRTAAARKKPKKPTTRRKTAKRATAKKKTARTASTTRTKNAKKSTHKRATRARA